jgi:hypothetical protein
VAARYGEDDTMRDASSGTEARDQSIARAARRAEEARAMVKAAKHLDGLCEVLNSHGALLPMAEMFALPKFGSAPAVTQGLWSWDDHRAIRMETARDGFEAFVIGPRP